jgi:Putative zinc-finger
MSDSVNNETDPFAEHDAAYVMGALTPDERRAFEEHLTDCPQCRQSVAELSGLTQLLDKVPLERVLSPGSQLEAPPDLMLPRLISAARVQRRRRAFQLVVSGAVAASVVAVAIAIGVNQTRSTPPAGVSVAMTAVKPTAVEATLQLAPAAWGTRVSLDCRWVHTPPGTDPNVKKVYRLIAVPRDGSAPQLLAQWAVLPGQDAKVTGSTNLAASGIASIELRSVADGSVLLRTQPRA